MNDIETGSVINIEMCAKSQTVFAENDADMLLKRQFRSQLLSPSTLLQERAKRKAKSKHNPCKLLLIGNLLTAFDTEI